MMEFFLMFRFFKISFVSISLLLSIGMLSSCSTGLSGETVYGRAESPLWFRSASRETIIAHFSKQCSSYGYKQGTDRFIDCLRKTESDSRARATARSNAVYQSIQNSGPTICSSTITGGSGVYTGNTTCY